MLPGKGGTGNQYQLTDTSADPILYYRIKITNIAGHSFYSRIIVLKNNEQGSNYIRLLNNPITSNIALQAAVQKTENLQLVLVDLSGKQLLKQTISVQAGINQLSIVIPPSCSKGVYLLQVTSQQLNATMRIMIGR